MKELLDLNSTKHRIKESNEIQKSKQDLKQG